MSGTGSLLLLFFVLAFGAILLVRAQRRRVRQAARATTALQPGTRVMTRAGLIASVAAVEGDELLLEVAPGVVCRYVAAAIGRVLETPGDANVPAESTPAAGRTGPAEPASAQPERVGRDAANTAPAGAHDADVPRDRTGERGQRPPAPGSPTDGDDPGAGTAD